MTERTENRASEIEALADLAKKFAETETLSDPTANGPKLFAVPDGRMIQDMTAAFDRVADRFKPARRKGTARFGTLQSLIDWTNRFKGDSSAMFAHMVRDTGGSAPDLSLTCVANYHAKEPAATGGDQGEPGAAHCDHRGIYKFPLSQEWKRWTAISGKWMDKDDLSAFIEDNAKDLIDPSPAVLKGARAKDAASWEIGLIEIAEKIMGRWGMHGDLIMMGREFAIHETSELEIKTDRDTGQAKVSFNAEHKDASGRPLTVPNLYLIAIPVFESGDLFRLALRFAYRKSGGSIKFSLTIYDAEKALETAFREAAQLAEKETGLPLFFGTPETS